MTDESYCPACGSKDHDDSILDESIVCEECGSVFDRDDRLKSKPHSTRDSQSNSDVTLDEVTRVTNGTQANVADGIDYLEDLSDRFELSSCSRTRAAEIFADVMKRNVSDGRPLKLMISGILFLSCRLEKEPRPVTDIAQATPYDSNQVVSAAKAIREEIDIEQPLVEPEEYLPWMSVSLDLDDSSITKASELLSNDTQHDHGKNPVATAAASLYLVAESHLTQRDVALAAGVTTETIRVRLNNLRDQTDV